MKQKIFSLLIGIATLSSPCLLEGLDNKIGVVSFANCIQESKYGKQEQSTIKAMQNQITSLIEDTEKQLQEIASKLNDAEYIDALSPEGEQELKIKFQNHQEDLQRYQQQYYQFINQANYKVMQTMNFHIKNAAKIVSAKLNLDYIFDENSVICNNAGIEVTNQIIQELDMLFDKEEKSKTDMMPVTTPSSAE